MLYRNILTAVDINTGEQVYGVGAEIKKHYKIIKKTRKTRFINSEYAEIHITWEMISKPQQLKLL